MLDHELDARVRLDLYLGFGVTLAIPAAPNRSICVRSDALRGHSRHEVGLPRQAWRQGPASRSR
jgi:hypothetical protein